MARAHVGKRMLELCRVLEAGIMDTEDLTVAMYGVTSSVLTRTIQSCLSLGVIERVGGHGRRCHPYRYRVKPNWLAIIESRPDPVLLAQQRRSNAKLFIAQLGQQPAPPRSESFVDFMRRCLPQ